MEIREEDLVGTATKLRFDDIKKKKVLSVAWEPKLEYAWDNGPALDRYLAELKKGRIIAKKCDKCELNQGSVGCCKGLKPLPGQKDVVVCLKCGELKGSAGCCKPGAKRCTKCPLKGGSAGCCKGLKPVACQQDIVICPKCGQVQGDARCCKPGAKECSKCGLSAGSPGCCKLDAFLKEAI